MGLCQQENVINTKTEVEQQLVCLNGATDPAFNNAMSSLVSCENPAEIDRSALSCW